MTLGVVNYIEGFDGVEFVFIERISSSFWGCIYRGSLVQFHKLNKSRSPDRLSFEKSSGTDQKVSQGKVDVLLKPY